VLVHAAEGKVIEITHDPVPDRPEGPPGGDTNALDRRTDQQAGERLASRGEMAGMAGMDEMDTCFATILAD
jgi:hypothetical protein